ncbi:hypothetical protein [Halalkaliarchaeum sp. AArc-CO]|uniref:hypothetical protein n=1 Tax=Halalkaliarchaeum sp. AArc-CO TaxID=2866381 RepID=UPI00217D612A|nr:hypothetical protein [Halalkaliarchaeum sp. AArc-CO]
MTGEETEGEGHGSRAFPRRRVLRTLGGISLVGIGGTGSASARGPPKGTGNGGPPNGNGGRPPDHAGGPPDDERGPPQSDDEDRTIEWGGQGSEHAEQDCPEQDGCWYWVLTPGGPEEFEEVNELEVTYEDGDTETYDEWVQRGNGAYQIEVCKNDGGTVEDAFVDVTGGGRNALLTISDGECKGPVYWQVDFGLGLSPPEVPKYEPEDFLMAAVGNSDRVSFNPSCTFPKEDKIDLLDREFDFDDEDNPTHVSVRFEVVSDEELDLHLAVFIRPPRDLTEEFDVKEVEEAAKDGECPIDADDVDVEEQVEFGVASGTFGSGEQHTLEIDLPTP